MKTKRILAAALAAAALLPGLGQAHNGADAPDTPAAALETLWESMWHQSGTPTRLVRWDTTVRWRLSGRNLPAHRDMVVRALNAVSQETGVTMAEAGDAPGEAINLRIEIVPDTALEDRQPCVTMLEFRTETRIDSAVVQMRERDVWRCAHHEAMHMMGVRGHPAGKTVLSYFPVKVDGLLPLDRVMLRAWYSPRMRPGMTPFEALPVLTEEWIATQSDKAAALRERDLFFQATIEQMQSYAQGRGDVPAIVRRSGKATDDGVRNGRGEMGYFLGVAYLEGVTVPAADRQAAVQWFERSASAGNRGAQARLAGMR